MERLELQSGFNDERQMNAMRDSKQHHREGLIDGRSVLYYFMDLRWRSPTSWIRTHGPASNCSTMVKLGWIKSSRTWKIT